MQGNIHFERTTRKERDIRPNRAPAPRQQEKRGKTWTRQDKRNVWASTPVTDLHQ